MDKTILIIGAGEGISQAVAEKFGSEGYAVGLINRNKLKGETMVSTLLESGFTAFSGVADVADPAGLHLAINKLISQLGHVDVLLYNAAAMAPRDILEVSTEELLQDFRVNVAGALHSIRVLYDEMRKRQGAVLITGGGLAIHPSPGHGSLSIGKAGLRNLALQLHERLKVDGIYVGMLTVNAAVSTDSLTHNPTLLAGKFWELLGGRNDAEVAV